MWPCGASTCALASLVFASMLMPARIAATAMTPMIVYQTRRMSGGLPVFENDGIQEEPEHDEAGEIDQVARGDQPLRERLETLADAHAPRRFGERRHVLVKE